MNDERRRGLDAERVGRVFGRLSREHAEISRPDDREATWASIEARSRVDLGSGRPVPRQRRLASAGRPVVLATAAAAVVLLVIGMLATRGGAPGYVVESEGGASVEVAEAEALEDRVLQTDALETTVAFADGSKITLRPETRLRLRVEAPRRVSAWLLNGGIRVHVEHLADTAYRFRAGRYEVAVIGTTFALSYEAGAARMNLDLAEGRVVVRDGEGGKREVVAGTRLELPETVEPAEPSPAERVEDSPEESPKPASRSSAVSADKLRPATVDYRALATSGKYAEIVEAAEREGIARVLATRAPSELGELAHAARYTGRTSLAVQVLEDLSLRHGSSSAGLRAPFFLGRIAEEKGHTGGALGLYAEYLDRNPRGHYAAEALGRKMTLVQRIRGPKAARPIAKDYLRRFPKGPYEALARSLVNEARSATE